MILDKRGMSLRQLSDKSGLPFETLRRLYNDQTKQYQQNTISIKYNRENLRSIEYRIIRTTYIGR